MDGQYKSKALEVGQGERLRHLSWILLAQFVEQLPMPSQDLVTMFVAAVAAQVQEGFVAVFIADRTAHDFPPCECSWWLLKRDVRAIDGLNGRSVSILAPTPCRSAQKTFGVRLAKEDR
jgi:hypothetical protein